MILGKKIGMTQVFNDVGELLPVTVVEAGPCYVTQVKEKSVQMGFGIAKKLNKPLGGHLKEQKLRHLKEFKTADAKSYQLGQEIKVDLFKAGELVRVTGTSIGKGTAGTVKRHHFHRGPMSHGSKCHRLPGSIGAGTTPGRVEKGTRMSGRMGNDRITTQNLVVHKVDAENGVLLIKGAIPGRTGGLVMVRTAVKRGEK